MFGRDALPVLEAAGFEVIGADLPEVDICEPGSVEAFFRRTAPQVVLNAAAFTDVDGAEEKEDEAFRANAKGPELLARACASAKALLVHISTDYVFPGERPEGYLPDDPPGPALGVYGRSKLEGEQAIIAALPKEGYLICRTQWLYGTTGKSFPDTILKLAATRKSLRVVNDQWGAPTWTRELARQIASLIHEGARGIRHAVNGGGPVTWYTFARQIVAEAGLDCIVEPCTSEEFPRPARRPTYAWLRDNDATNAQPWQEGLREYLAKIVARGKR
jgi:dTDP-4-dehydrorhamnose reductase